MVHRLSRHRLLVFHDRLVASTVNYNCYPSCSCFFSYPPSFKINTSVHYTASSYKHYGSSKLGMEIESDAIKIEIMRAIESD